MFYNVWPNVLKTFLQYFCATGVAYIEGANIIKHLSSGYFV